MRRLVRHVPNPPLRLLWICGLLSLGALGLAKGVRARCVDFEVYHRAVQRLLSGEQLYRLADGKMQFKYPPPAVSLFTPWGLGSLQLGGALWNLAAVACFACAAHLFCRHYRDELWQHTASAGSAARLRWMPLAATVVLSPAMVVELSLGQVDLMILALLVATAVAVDRRLDWPAGAALGAAVVLKPPAGLLVLYACAQKRYQVPLAAAATGMVLCLPLLVVYGADGTWQLFESWRANLAASTLPWARAGTSQSLTTLMVLVLPASPQVTPLELMRAQLVATALVLALLAVLRPRRVHAFACLSLAVALLSPLGWRANFVLAWPAASLLAIGGREPVARGLGWAVLAGLLGVGVWLNEGLYALQQVKALLGQYRPLLLCYAAMLVITAWQGRRWPPCQNDRVCLGRRDSPS